MAHESELLKIQPDIIVNVHNVTYIELTAKGGMDIHFVGKQKPLHLNSKEAESLRNYVSGESVADVTSAGNLQVVHRRKA
jgi:hypothetical protein